VCDAPFVCWCVCGCAALTAAGADVLLKGSSMLEEDVLAMLDDEGRSDIERSDVSGIRSN